MLKTAATRLQNIQENFFEKYLDLKQMNPKVKNWISQWKFRCNKKFVLNAEVKEKIGT